MILFLCKQLPLESTLTGSKDRTLKLLGPAVQKSLASQGGLPRCPPPSSMDEGSGEPLYELDQVIVYDPNDRD